MKRRSINQDTLTRREKECARTSIETGLRANVGWKASRASGALEPVEGN